MQHLRQATATILGFSSAEQVSPARGLMDLGIDSLMAVSLRNELTRDLAVTLPATLTFDYPTLNLLHAYLMTELFADLSLVDAGVDTQQAVIDDLTEDELATLLSQEFSQEG